MIVKPNASIAHCPLCLEDGGRIIFRHTDWRIVVAHEPEFPGFCRVIWNHHVAEMSDLPADQTSALLRAVETLERALRSVLEPDKINLASLGNAVPHLHWHVIPRWVGDSRWPQPVWAPKLREFQRELPAQWETAVAAAFAANYLGTT